MILSSRLKSFLPQASVASHFEAYEKATLTLPEDGARPEQIFLSEHRKRYRLA